MSESPAQRLLAWERIGWELIDAEPCRFVSPTDCQAHSATFSNGECINQAMRRLLGLQNPPLERD